MINHHRLSFRSPPSLLLPRFPSLIFSSKMAPAPMKEIEQQIKMQDEEVGAILASLPKSKASWRQPDTMCQYKGVWIYPDRLPSVLWLEQHFTPDASDLLLVTSMKVGTTWLKALAFAIAERHHCTSDDPHHPLLNHISHDLVRTLEYNGIQHVKDSNTSMSRIFHTHLHYSIVGDALKRSNCRVVYLHRNLGDTFVSMWKFFGKLSGSDETGDLPLEEAFEMFCRGASLYGPFWDHVMGYWNASKERPDQFLFLNYEELQNDQTQQVKRLAEFLGFPFSQEEEEEGAVEKIMKLCSFEKLSNLEVNKTGLFLGVTEYGCFYGKGRVGDSAKYLRSEMIQRLNTIAEEKLRGCDLIKQFLM